ncbi:4-hydroxy-tetrahydrodipicolinate reductase [Pseudoglutamicibacter cumminsii]|uniref:4-hydroxy-tetrahydrodipicolinate reductase n=1 Tax=Pseudoglutamicibacter cumminsii TaxID=156979 RepID=A0AAP4FDT6_9MICC|nr:4-hydroxy-tetrahydrodipicolinate reductase [Pseudoglutamicibacter cumminsii]MDK6275609.1 4-hydroxy-tetrahydrodipicolinate reductase [Pseudoglutamicibacter cumminsii]
MTSPIRVAIIGARGRMGSQAVAAVGNAEDMEVVAQIGRGDSLEAMVDAGATHMVDLSVPSATADNVAFAIEHGIHAVVGATGWDNERLASVRKQLEDKPDVGVLIAPNFALGAVLAAQFAAKAAPYFESVEVIEMHHPDKVDAPSGTADRTARMIAEARAEAGTAPSPDATETDPDGSRGAVIDGVNVHAVRLRGLVAHQEVLLGSEGEMLTIRHDSFDRVSFMSGVLLGLRTVAQRPGLTHGLEGYLDLGA